MIYADLKQGLLKKHPKSELTPLTESEVTKIREAHPSVPNDLIDFLLIVGWGTVGRMSFMIYSGLLRPENVYDTETAHKLKNVLLIGDDFSGYCVGYDTGKSWLLGEIDGSGEFTECSHSKTLSEFVENRFLL